MFLVCFHLWELMKGLSVSVRSARPLIMPTLVTAVSSSSSQPHRRSGHGSVEVQVLYSESEEMCLSDDMSSPATARGVTARGLGSAMVVTCVTCPRCFVCARY